MVRGPKRLLEACGAVLPNTEKTISQAQFLLPANARTKTRENTKGSRLGTASKSSIPGISESISEMRDYLGWQQQLVARPEALAGFFGNDGRNADEPADIAAHLLRRWRGAGNAGLIRRRGRRGPRVAQR